MIPRKRMSHFSQRKYAWGECRVSTRRVGGRSRSRARYFRGAKGDGGVLVNPGGLPTEFATRGPGGLLFNRGGFATEVTSAGGSKSPTSAAFPLRPWHLGVMLFRRGEGHHAEPPRMQRKCKDSGRLDKLAACLTSWEAAYNFFGEIRGWRFVTRDEIKTCRTICQPEVIEKQLISP